MYFVPSSPSDSGVVQQTVDSVSSITQRGLECLRPCVVKKRTRHVYASLTPFRWEGSAISLDYIPQAVRSSAGDGFLSIVESYAKVYFVFTVQLHSY